MVHVPTLLCNAHSLALSAYASCIHTLAAWAVAHSSDGNLGVAPS